MNSDIFKSVRCWREIFICHLLYQVSTCMLHTLCPQSIFCIPRCGYVFSGKVPRISKGDQRLSTGVSILGNGLSAVSQ